MIANRGSAERYSWGTGCDGWRLLDRPDLSVTEERIPPGAGERRHVHASARQLFYVLSGRLTIDRASERYILAPGDGLEISPGVPHRVLNATDRDVSFLVVSAPTTREDRTDLD